jgi:hypothetical protein
MGRRRVTVVVSIALLMSVLGSAAAFASEGPPKDPFYTNDQAWACEGEAGLPPDHCINVRSQGNTGVIKVFYPDARWPQEGISFDPKADRRPCPHDPNADPDGTWWSPFPGAYVCHHRP